MDGIVCWSEDRYGPLPASCKLQRYVWCVWEPDQRGATTFGWLSARDFR